MSRLADLRGFRAGTHPHRPSFYTDVVLRLELDLGLGNTFYVLDACTIDLCLSIFPWPLSRSTKSAVKSHTLLDLQGNIPAFIRISDSTLHDANVRDLLLPEPDAFYIRQIAAMRILNDSSR